MSLSKHGLAKSSFCSTSWGAARARRFLDALKKVFKGDSDQVSAALTEHARWWWCLLCLVFLVFYFEIKTKPKKPKKTMVFIMLGFLNLEPWLQDCSNVSRHHPSQMFKGGIIITKQTHNGLTPPRTRTRTKAEWKVLWTQWFRQRSIFTDKDQQICCSLSATDCALTFHAFSLSRHYRYSSFHFHAVGEINPVIPGETDLASKRAYSTWNLC